MKIALKVIAVTLVICMCLPMLFACDDGGKQNTTETPTQSTADNPTDTPTDIPTDVPTEPSNTPHVHTEVIDTAVAPTCTNTGLTEGKHCSECGEVLVAQKEISIIDHDYDENYKCGFCGKVVITTEGLKYTLINNGTEYEVSGIGTATDTDIVIPKTYNGLPVTSVGGTAFGACSSLTSINIPDSVTTIGESAFAQCASLKSITIPKSVTSIGYAIFGVCPLLESITVDTNNSVYHSSGNCIIKTSDKTLVAGCKNSIIPSDDSVTSIHEYAFYGCCSLTSITIPESITSIGEGAFDMCYSLVDVYNKSSLNITVGSSENGYVGCYALNVYTPTSGESKIHTTDDGYIFYVDGDMRYLVKYIGTKTELTLPEKCQENSYEIYRYAFVGDIQIKSVIISDNVTSIGWGAFGDCYSLTNVAIGDGITNIGDSVFADCSSLTSVTMGNSVISIGNRAFLNCDSLTSITISNRVTSIAGSAFSGCSSLTSITIPDSVTSIGDSAFEDCFSLTSINFSGTKAEWKAISKDSCWNYYCTGNCTVYCTDGTIAKDGTET